MIEAELFSYLQSEGAITALVGARIFPDAAPQTAALPLIIYSKQSTDREITLKKAVGVCTARIDHC